MSAVDSACAAMDEAIALIAKLRSERATAVQALTEIARLRTDLRGDFSMGSRQSDIARKALAAIEGEA